ncbi:protein of unknown function [Streptantibioticus cattleyicolor NRRL 8057 = DSM 46488]|nr:protein of unknown function [Streptantibioticus cattleyicolor NRRL 8057 = DSM 46488]
MAEEFARLRAAADAAE